MMTAHVLAALHVEGWEPMRGIDMDQTGLVTHFVGPQNANGQAKQHPRYAHSSGRTCEQLVSTWSTPTCDLGMFLVCDAFLRERSTESFRFARCC